MSEMAPNSVSGYIGVVFLCLLGLSMAVAMLTQSNKVAPPAVCYDTGESRVVSVHDSSIQSTIGYEYQVQCNNGETYWR